MALTVPAHSNRARPVVMKIGDVWIDPNNFEVRPDGLANVVYSFFEYQIRFHHALCAYSIEDRRALENGERVQGHSDFFYERTVYKIRVEEGALKLEGTLRGFVEISRHFSPRCDAVRDHVLVDVVERDVRASRHVPIEAVLYRDALPVVPHRQVHDLLERPGDYAHPPTTVHRRVAIQEVLNVRRDLQDVEHHVVRPENGRDLDELYDTRAGYVAEQRRNADRKVSPLFRGLDRLYRSQVDDNAYVFKSHVDVARRILELFRNRAGDDEAAVSAVVVLAHLVVLHRSVDVALRRRVVKEVKDTLERRTGFVRDDRHETNV